MAARSGHWTSNRLFFHESRVDRMGGAGRGARVIPTDEPKTAPLSHSAAVFTPVVPVDHAADDPESGAFGPALAAASASSNADAQAYVSRLQASC